ncbi:alpha/beta hydrolase [Microbacterium sp. LRZ72]|uniref:alpha/beta hydrolase n=1 Tax=Microbacterium sp. LRZ72 TaxID=2942481 RepID=UPI0029B8D74D|nr:alpha/beta hydrolase [Microbacterium sp. LRZ72]MDX2376481.1 alpha/beta hydrolase [Microbacterium sp. LRZ72]
MPEFTDAHGIQIVYDVHRAQGAVRGIVQLLHGVGEHAGRYGELIDALTSAGFTVYADDHRGHGRTGMRQHGDADRLGTLGPGGLQAALAAVWQLTGMIRAENPGVPIVLLGHSWGSFLAQMLLDRHPDAYDALVLSGSALRWPGSLNAGDLNAPWAGGDPTGLAWLSTDPAVADEFAADPLTTSRPLLRLFGVVDSARLFGRPRRGLRAKAGREVPVLLMVGRDDTVGGPVSVHRLARAYRERAGLGDVTTLVYPGMRHEIFNEIGRERVRADLLAWLDARLPAR